MSAAPPPGSDGAVVVLTAAAGGSAPAGRGPLFTAGPDGRLTIRVGRDGGGGGGGGRGAGLGHVGYYVNGDNAGHDEWTAAADDDAGGAAGGAAPPPSAVLLPPPAALRSRLGAKADDRLSVAAIDTAGNMASWDC